MPSQAAQPYQEYRKHIESAQNITALTDDLMGDSVSLYNGATEFTATDIDLPGNNALPVQLKRRFSIEIIPGGSHGSSAGDPNLRGIGNWDIEVPYISGVYGPQAWETTRCSVGANPSVPAPLDVTDVWQGNTVHVPGAGDRKMLKRVWAEIPQPSDGVDRKWTTRERDMFTCIPMQSGLAGEGFLMQTASGLRYYFDNATTRYAGFMTYQPGEGFPSSSVNRTKYYLLASKIADRFGNTVTFTYNANGYPTSIASSDGRTITLTYTGTRLAAAIVHDSISGLDRTWQYAYGTGAEDGMLKVVTPPDGNAWRYAHVGTLFPDDGGIWDGGSGTNCGIKPPPVTASFNFTVTHPSGAIGTFQFGNQRHPRSGVHANACVDRLVQQNGTWVHTYKLYTPNYFDVMSLSQKTITGAGLATLTWTYEYPFGSGALWGARGQAFTYPCTTCAAEKTVTVHEPDGTSMEYRYGFLYASNEGRLLGSTTLDAAGSPRRIEATEYLPESVAAGQNFYPVYGFGFGPDDPSTLAVRPVIEHTIQQDGATFTMQVKTGCVVTGRYCFDTYGQPTAVTKFSSLGNTKDELTDYHNDTDLWVLGQVAKTTVAGLVASGTGYDAMARPTWTEAFGKLQQTLTYYSGSTVSQLGTVASVSDGRDSGGFNTTVLLSNWKRGTPQAITYPATPDQPGGESQSAVVDENGWIRSVSDENSYLTSYGYDAMGRLASITYPANSPSWNGTTQSFSPTTGPRYGLPAGHWWQVVKTGNGYKVVSYDAMWRPVVEESYDNGNAAATRSIVVKRYDINGRLAFQSYPLRTLGSYTDATLKGVWTEYDALGRVTATRQDSEIGVLATTTSYLAGFKTQVKTPRQQGTSVSTTTSFKAWDTPITDYPVAVAAPEGVYVDIERDAFGKPLSIKRGNATDTTSITRSLVYNPAQELCKTIEPETASTLMAYDAAGNLAWTAGGQAAPSTSSCDTAPVAERTTRSYDARNRVKSLVFPDNRGNTTYTYTPDGLVASVATNVAGQDNVITSYAYNTRRLPASEQLQVGAFTWPLTYAYDSNAHLASHTYPDGLAIAYTPNALGQPTKAGSYATGVTYHPTGGMAGFTYGNGIVHSMTLTAVRPLPDRSMDSGGVLDDSYAYDGNGNVAAISDGLSAHRGDRDMTYDYLDRLKSTTSPMFAGGTLYTYDVLDNLVRVKAPGRDHTYVYDQNWRLTNVTNTSGGDTVIGLDYDAQGNLANKSGQLFDFDRGNRLREATGKERYVYDGHGRRVQSVHATLGSIYSMYGQDGVLRYQRNERKGSAIDYITLNGSLVARVTNAVAPPVPALTAPSYVTTGSYTVSWNTVTSATRYELQERANGGSWVQIQSSAATSKAISGKASGIYDYQVRACNAECGGWSAEASVAVELPPDTIPTLSAPATALNGSYTLSWTAPGGAETYTLQESANGGAWTAAYDGVAQSKAYSGKAAGSYGYHIRACNPAGCTGYSATKTVQVILPPTATATLTTPASNATGGYTVSWTAVAAATSYTLEEQVGSGAWTAFGANAGTSQAISGRANGSYSYRVKGCNAAGCGPVSAVKTTTVLHPPASAPTLTVPATSTTGSYTVSWTTVSTATSYEIQESVNGGSWAALYTGTATSKAVSGKATDSYSYRGRACNASGCSAYSAVKTITVTLPPKAAPTLTAPASTTTGSFTVSWTTVTDAVTFTLEQQFNGGSWSSIYSNTGTSYAATNRLAGTWGYRVKACNTVGCGPYSAVKSVTSTAPTPPPAPTGLKAVTSGNSCTVSWNASAGATYYELRKTLTVYSGPGTSYFIDAACPAGNPWHVRACNATTCSAWVP